MNLRGRVWKYGDDINTDVIFPGRYLHLLEPAEMAEHAMEDLDEEFGKGVQEGDIVIAGKNFGCGSSREQAVTCLKHAGVGTIIAKSYARIFYRNAINLGVPIVISPEITDKVSKGDDVEVFLDQGVVYNHTTGEQIEFQPLPEFVLEIINAGGLIPYTRRKLGIEAEISIIE